MTVREKKEKKGERNREKIEKNKKRGRGKEFFWCLCSHIALKLLYFYIVARVISSDAKVRKTICQYADFTAWER